MNRALLNDLRHRRAYPSVTVLVNTTPAEAVQEADADRLARLVADADRRLAGDVDDVVRAAVVASLVRLVDERRDIATSQTLALCASPDHAVAVVLGRAVDERVVVDDTFAARDLVADLNRTAVFRVVTMSDRMVRLLIGDRQRLVEERGDDWPLVRQPDTTSTCWGREVGRRVRSALGGDPLPTVVAGVERRLRDTVALDLVPTIGVIPGNHDRTGWADLHRAAWPMAPSTSRWQTIPRRPTSWTTWSTTRSKRCCASVGVR
jgi:hypothetical protein